MAEEQLREAFALMKAGKRREAVPIVRAILQQDADNAAAWWLMANLLDDNESGEWHVC